MKALFLAPLLPLLASPVLADERPPFVGAFATACGNYQCWIDIERTGIADGYRAIMIVADRKDWDRWTPCVFPMLMHFAGDHLLAHVSGEPVEIRYSQGGAISLAGIPAERCTMPLNGEYQPVAD
ncbi:hypothetical protein ELG97_37085 [Rhizobium leguminosarum]|uniref:hypothetical protein n=1 Tax=Rhizobium leguminosarum TaxID=384 RepID=UPI0010312D2A|nr:hypothetical protein [Rhizobium leguminosarum]TBE73846.1 hypothetical protein ELG97_37085 [Rhizobium leguminosarum]